MEFLKTLQELKHIKILADSRRLSILQLLMVKPATLTHLGQILGEHPARIRHHLKLLEKAGLVELVEQRVVRGFVEKYYQAGASAFQVNQLILPDAGGASWFTFLGSHDLALELLARELTTHAGKPFTLNILPVGSLDGLIALRQGIAQIAGCHLLDPQSGEYNTPFVRRLFPDRSMRLITFALREQGLLLAPGNPLGISQLEDLCRPEVKIINRNRGSGTRLWLDLELRKRSISGELLHGYGVEVRTHTALAAAVSEGHADAGIGLRAAGRNFGLHFIPLFHERYDLVFPLEQSDHPMVVQILELLKSASFHQKISTLEGYDTTQTGQEIVLD